MEKKKSQNIEVNLGDLDIKAFKRLLIEMYEGFPNTFVPKERIDKVLVNSETKGNLLDKEYLIVSNLREREYYGLGPNALNLVTSWKIEELTHDIKFLTKIMILLVIMSIFLSITFPLLLRLLGL